MKLIDLKDKQITANFETALREGLATDGGLYVPESIPLFLPSEQELLMKSDFKKVAQVVIAKWLDGEIPDTELDEIVNRAFNFEIPIVSVGDMKVLELFHGPTFAFKDVAAQFLASCVDYYVKKRNRPTNIVVATSGDTGGAIAHAFGGLEDIKVFVLFPKDRVSKLQKEQLTRCKDNIEPIEIAGSFDDCQRLVKQALSDRSLGIDLSSANSINIGRLLPQTTYYAYAASKLGGYEAVIPTGNLGNATAALMAHKMGLGPKHITLASNANDTIERFSKTGDYQPMSSIETLSNAMDVGDPNNFPRFTALLNQDINSFRSLVDVFAVSDKTTIETIKRVYEEHDYLLDPHTAVAWHAAALSNSSLPKVVVSTASPMKFAAEIKETTGIDVDTELITNSLVNTENRFSQLPSGYNDFKYFLYTNAL